MWLQQQGAEPRIQQLTLQWVGVEPTWWVEFGVWFERWAGLEGVDGVCWDPEHSEISVSSSELAASASLPRLEWVWFPLQWAWFWKGRGQQREGVWPPVAQQVLVKLSAVMVSKTSDCMMVITCAGGGGAFLRGFV